MSKSELAQANTIVAAVTRLLELVHDADEDEVLLRIYEDEESFRVAHPDAGHIDAGHLDAALHARTARTAARAACRIGHDVTVVRLRAGPMRAWLARQAPSGAGPQDSPASRRTACPARPRCGRSGWTPAT